MSGTLTHSPADVVRNLLIGLGFGTTPSDAGSWPIYVASEPNTPDSVITVFDTVGTDSGREMVLGERQEHHGIQIRIRDAEHADGYTKARVIAVALDETIVNNTSNVSSTGYTVYAITRTSDVLAIGKETPTSKRSIFTINALVALRQN